MNEQIKERRLSQIDPNTIPSVPFQDQTVQVYICDVHDGDSVTMIMDLGDIGNKGTDGVIVPFKIALRLQGIDTPEITAGSNRLPEEKNAAIIARDYLKSLVLGYANVKVVSWDKYGGRVLGDIILPNGKTASEKLIKKGYARAYHGEKKKEWTHKELTNKPFDKKTI